MRRSTAVISGHPWGQYAAVLLALAVGLAGLSNAFHRRPIDHPPGALVSSEPRQSPIANPIDMRFGEYTLRSRAEFVLEARLLASKKYRFDPGAGLAPYDFALGWGPMSDSAVLTDLDISQGARFFTIRPREAGLDLPLLLQHSANMHLIPANDAVARLLQGARVGHVVRLQGRLVDAVRDDGFAWRTSLTRSDTGAGACELVYVESVSLW